MAMTKSEQFNWANESNDSGVAFASDLGWKPGEWPLSLFVLFHGVPVRYVRTSEIRQNDEFQGMLYSYLKSSVISVFND